jgi:hypothetical protein
MAYSRGRLRSAMSRCSVAFTSIKWNICILSVFLLLLHFFEELLLLLSLLL